MAAGLRRPARLRPRSAGMANSRGASMAQSASRTVLSQVFDAALQAVQGERLIVARSRLAGGVWEYRDGDIDLRWPLPPAGRVLVVGAGKATAALPAGLE